MILFIQDYVNFYEKCYLRKKEDHASQIPIWANNFFIRKDFHREPLIWKPSDFIEVSNCLSLLQYLRRTAKLPKREFRLMLDSSLHCLSQLGNWKDIFPYNEQNIGSVQLIECQRMPHPPPINSAWDLSCSSISRGS